MRFINIVIGILAMVSLAWAHGGDLLGQIATRQEYGRHNKMDLDHCAGHMAAKGLFTRTAERVAVLTDLVKKEKRDAGPPNELLNTSHEAPETFTAEMPTYDLYMTDMFHSCVLSPWDTEGPYYIEGEYVRGDLLDGQRGVPVFLDLQILDTLTCEPVPGVYVEIWSANANGVYGGVHDTFLRGLQPTDINGSVSFATIFPGHYPGRANHIHVLTHANARPLPNGTIFDNTVSHSGQIFFDQDLIDKVESLPPYSSNTIKATMNRNDWWLFQELTGSDPFLEWFPINVGDLNEGIVAWTKIGVNLSNVAFVTPEGALSP